MKQHLASSLFLTGVLATRVFPFAPVAPLCAAESSFIDELLKPKEAPFKRRAPLRRIDEIEKQVAALLPKLRTTEAASAKLIQADINVRLIARALLKTGSDAESGGEIAILYGNRIADHADEIAALLSGAAAQAAKALPTTATAADISAAAASVAEAIDQFNQANDGSDEKLDAKSLDIEQYLQRHMAPLANVISLTGGKPLETTWLHVARADEADAAVLGGALSRADLDALEKRIGGLGLPAATKTEMVAMVTMMRDAMDQPDLRPRVGIFYDLLDRSADVAEELTSAQGLDAATVTELRGQVHTATILIKDPRTRAAGAERLRLLARSLELVRKLNALSQQGAATERPMALLLAGINLHLAQQDTENSAKILNYVERLSQSMLLYRRLLGDTLPLDLRRVSLQIRKDYQTLELKLIGTLPALVIKPTRIGEPAWNDDLAVLEAAATQLQRVHHVPAWVEQLNRYKPRPSNTLFQRLRELATEPAAPGADGTIPARSLAALEQQAALFDPMPYEKKLREPDDAVRHVTQDTELLLVEQIERLRQEWATAWATGGDPGPTAERLMLMRRLLQSLELSSEIYGSQGVGERLNQWAAWQVSPQSLDPLLKLLPERVAAASRLGSIGNWPGLAEMLTQIEQESTLQLLVARLYGELGEGLAKLPTGAPGTLSQCLYGPTENSFGVTHRAALAAICVDLSEAAADVGNTAGLRDPALARVGRAARGVLQAMDSAKAN